MAALTTLLVLAGTARADLSSGFEAGPEGWSTNGRTIVHQPSGGNPGGHVEFTADGDSLVSGFVSPDAWDGDRRSSIGRRLIFDMRIQAVDPNLRVPLLIMGGGDGTSLEFRTGVSSSPDWQRFEILLQPGPGWQRADGTPPTQSDFENVMGRLAFLQLRAEHDQRTGTTGLDNVVLQAPPPPEPDLSGSVRGPSRVALRDTFSASVSVNNPGVGVARAVSVTIDLPDTVDASKVRVSPSEGTCQDPSTRGTFTCSAGDMNAGDTVFYDLILALVATPSREELVAEVRSQTPDPDLANNRAVLEIVSFEGEGEGGGGSPVLGRSVGVSVVSGVVRIRRPGKGFVRLRGDEAIPVGSEVDVSKGRVALTSAVNRSGKTQTAEFFDGRFVVRQNGREAGLTELRLSGPKPACGKSARASAKKRTRRVWGDGKGKFRTRGQGGAATVRGTRWLTEDRCGGTFFQVKRGAIDVRDFARGKTVRVKAGKSYFAKTRRR